jgi:hypothetical protein
MTSLAKIADEIDNKFQMDGWDNNKSAPITFDGT